MLVRIKQDDKGWQITGLSAPLYQETLGRAEGVRLAHVHFHHKQHTVTGHLVALYGAELEEAVFETAEVVHALGLGVAFKPCHRQAGYDAQTCNWFDAESGGDLAEARMATILGSSIFYSTEDDVRAARRAEMEESVTAPSPILARMKGLFR